VIYESMSISLNKLNMHNPELALSEAQLDVNGKRGKATLAFNVLENGEVVGSGTKSMVLSGLREYDQAAIDKLVSDYSANKDSY